MPTWRQAEIAISLFWIVWTFACVYMGYLLGSDVNRPIRDHKGRFVKRD